MVAQHSRTRPSAHLLTCPPAATPSHNRAIHAISFYYRARSSTQLGLLHSRPELAGEIYDNGHIYTQHNKEGIVGHECTQTRAWATKTTTRERTNGQRVRTVPSLSCFLSFGVRHYSPLVFFFNSATSVHHPSLASLSFSLSLSFSFLFSITHLPFLRFFPLPLIQPFLCRF